jgi:hypothetical protein
MASRNRQCFPGIPSAVENSRCGNRSLGLRPHASKRALTQAQLPRAPPTSKTTRGGAQTEDADTEPQETPPHANHETHTTRPPSRSPKMGPSRSKQRQNAVVAHSGDLGVSPSHKKRESRGYTSIGMLMGPVL